MHGQIALEYARSRHDTNDYSRARRQQEVVGALRTRLAQADALRALPAIIDSVGTTLETDLDPANVLPLARTGTGISPSDIRSEVLYPCGGDYPHCELAYNGDSGFYLLPDRAKVRDLAAQLFYDPRIKIEDARVAIENTGARAGAAKDVADRLEVDPRDAPCDRSHLSLTDRTAVDGGDRRDLHAGAAEERLVDGVELGAVDAPDLDRDLLILRDTHDVRTHDALEDVIGGRGRDERPVAHEEQVRGAPFGDVAVVGQDDRLVEAGLLRLGLRQRGVHVRAGDLAARGDGVVVDAAPRGDLRRDAALDRNIVAEGDGEHGEGVFEVVETDTDELAGLEYDGPDVGVFAITALPEELDGDVYEVLDGVRDRKSHDPARFRKARVVLPEMQPVELLLVGVPVRPDPFEDARAVVEGMGHHADLGLADGDELAAEVGPRRVGRGAPRELSGPH